MANLGQSGLIRTNRGQMSPIGAYWGILGHIGANQGKLGPIRANCEQFMLIGVVQSRPRKTNHGQLGQSEPTGVNLGKSGQFQANPGRSRPVLAKQGHLKPIRNIIANPGHQSQLEPIETCPDLLWPVRTFSYLSLPVLTCRVLTWLYLSWPVHVRSWRVLMLPCHDLSWPFMIYAFNFFALGFATMGLVFIFILDLLDFQPVVAKRAFGKQKDDR